MNHEQKEVLVFNLRSWASNNSELQQLAKSEKCRRVNIHCTHTRTRMESGHRQNHIPKQNEAIREHYHHKTRNLETIVK